MSCNYYRGKCLFLNGKEDSCKDCSIKKAYNKGVRDVKKDGRPQSDLISREALKKEIENLVVGGAEGLKDYYENGSKSDENSWIGGIYDAWEQIDNAPTVETDIEVVAKDAYEHGYADGWKERFGEPERLQGEYVNISKLRLMKTEECAGHTIDYAMGWKACIEWIKKGGAENDKTN